MPFRFRKIISFGKGFRLNFSKRGMSASLGGPGATLNLGKRGVRPTVGIPGTGLSFTPTQSQAKISAGPIQANSAELGKNIVYLVVFGILICCISAFCLSMIFGGTNPIVSTPTPPAQLDPQIIIVRTVSAAQTQTMLVSPFTSTPFVWDTPTMMPPVTLAPTWTLEPTQTPFVLSTSDAPPFESPCVCNADTYNCGDPLAISCFNYCRGQGAGDIHNLDGDGDGLVCEQDK